MTKPTDAEMIAWLNREIDMWLGPEGMPPKAKMMIAIRDRLAALTPGQDKVRGSDIGWLHESGARLCYEADLDRALEVVRTVADAAGFERGRQAGLEEAARLVDGNVQTLSDPREFRPRTMGNRHGMEYADAIRAIAAAPSSSTGG